MNIFSKFIKSILPKPLLVIRLDEDLSLKAKKSISETFPDYRIMILCGDKKDVKVEMYGGLFFKGILTKEEEGTYTIKVEKAANQSP